MGILGMKSGRQHDKVLGWENPSTLPEAYHALHPSRDAQEHLMHD